MTPTEAYLHLLSLIRQSPAVADFLLDARRLSASGRHIDSQIRVAMAADMLRHDHPAEIPDAILLRDVLAVLVLDHPMGQIH